MSRRFNFRRLLALLLAAMCLCGVFAQAEETAAPATNPEIPAEYKLVAENSRFNLYLHEDTVAIIVESKESGKLLWSTLRDPENHKATGNWPSFYQSGVILEYIEDLKGTNGQANPVKNDAEITYDYVENGFTAHISYKDIGISHDLVLTMDEAGLHVSVPQDSFVEVLDQPYIIIKEDGEEVRVDLTKYEKTKEVTEYILVLEDGTEYTIPMDTTVSKNGKTALNVPDSAGTTQVVPMQVKTITVKNEAGEDVVVPHYRAVAKTDKGAETYMLVVGKQEYPLNADQIVKVKNGKITLRAADGKTKVTLNLDAKANTAPTVTIVDAAGKGKNVSIHGDNAVVRTEEDGTYTLIADGAEYPVPQEIVIRAKKDTIVLRATDGKTKLTLPLNAEHDPMPKAIVGDGVEIALDDTVVTVRTVNKYILVTDGAEYPIPAEMVSSAKEGQLIVNGSDGKTKVTLSLDVALAPTPTIAVTDKDGAAVQLPMDKPVSYRTNLYRSCVTLQGETRYIPVDDVVQVMDTSYTVAGIYIFPFLGYSYVSQDPAKEKCTTCESYEGYMIVPDGQGAIVKLENNEGRYKNPFSRPVYGLNIGVDGEVHSRVTEPVEPVIMPVFGMVHTADQIGFLGVVEEGDYGCTIQAYMNGNTVSSFDWTCAKFTYRMVYNQPMGVLGTAVAATVPTRTEKTREMDVTLHFLLEDGADASYAGLAVAYRDYLISKGAFAKASDRPFDVQLDFVGLERENYIFGKQDVVMTSFEHTAEILRKLKEDGVDEMSVVLRGWQKDGLTGGLPVDGFNPAGSLGGKRGLKELRTYCEEQGIDFALEVDVLKVNTETHPTLIYSAFEMITSRTYERPTFGKVYSTIQYLTPSASADKAAKVVRELAQNDVKGISFTGIPSLMADYSFKDVYYSTTDMANAYIGIMQNANENLTVTLSAPNAYLWPYADVISDLPVGGSDHTYTDAEIPFLTIALSGQIPYYIEYVNFQANTHEFFLHLMEQGARPAFLLTWEDPIELQDTNSAGIYSSRFELYEEMIVTWYKDLSALYDVVGEDGVIVNHERNGNMVRVTWDNGAQVYLNFGDTEATFDDVTLGKLEWKVVPANGN